MEKFKHIFTVEEIKDAALKSGGFITPLDELHEVALIELTDEINKKLEDILRDI